MTDTQYYSLLTKSGHNANIKAKALGLPIVLSKVAFGSGNITPIESATKLVKEEIRVNINSIVQNETDKNILEIEAVIPSDMGGFLVNEAALYLEDGTLYAVANLPTSYKPNIDQGAGKEFTFTIYLTSVGVENVTLKIDDSIVFATRKYVQNELKKYAFINGDETKKFKVADAVEPDEAINKKQFDESSVKSTGNQTIEDIKTFRKFPITPSFAPTSDYQVANKKYVDDNAGAKIATTAEAQAFMDNTKAITPLSLSGALKGSNQNLTANGYQKLPGGLIIQWGEIPNMNGNTKQTITLPISYPTYYLNFVSFSNDSSAGTLGESPGSKRLSNSQIEIGNGCNYTETVSWFTIGY